MSAVGDSTNIFSFYAAVNDASNGFLGFITIIAFFTIILFALLRSNPVPESFTGAATTATVISLIFLWLELTGLVVVTGFTILWSMSLIALYRSNSV